MTVVNIYAPNNDQPDFFSNIFNIVLKMNMDHLVIGGDYNLVLNEELDSHNRKTNNRRARTVIQNLMEEQSLVDIYRVLNESKKRYTCFKKNPTIASRIDFLLVDSGIANQTSNSNIISSVVSDHNIIEMCCALNISKRGPGIWRLNVMALENEHTCDKIAKKIVEIKQYRHMGIMEQWEEVKFQAKLIFQGEARDAQSIKRKHLKTYHKAIECLEEEILQENNVYKATQAMQDIKAKIDDIEHNLSRGAIVRSRAKWDEQGERNTKYFFSLEKRNYTKKNMTKLYREDGSEISEQKHILEEQRKFYEELYKGDDSVKFDISNDTGVRLSAEIKEKLEEDISKEEMFLAMKSMAYDKAPGTDGLPIEFYDKFWEHLVDLLYELYMHAYDKGKLNKTAHTGVISLLPKGDKNPFYLKNWRPLTLLNLDYKILAKMMAARMKQVLPDIIGTQQTGFMENRQISENIVKTIDVIAYANRKKKRQLIVSIDFEKCFDRVAYCAILGSLKYFNFGDNYVRWINLFFTEFCTCTQNNGYMSEYIVKGRSINQGCPVSPYAYLLCGEVLAHCLKRNVKGITIGEIRLLLSQFADDTIVYIDYDLSELNAVIDTLMYIERHAGLKISYDKTIVYRIGSARNSAPKLYTKKELTWSDGDINLLGVKIANSDSQSVQCYDECIKKAEAICYLWRLRPLTLMGKVLVFNTLIGSLFVYKMMVMPQPTRLQIKKLNKLARKFLWKNKKPKIALKVLQNPKNKGGLKLVDFEIKWKALKLSWVPKILKTQELSYIYQWLIPGVGEWIWRANLKREHVYNIIQYDTHWREVFATWCELSYNNFFDGCEVREQPLWLNSNIIAENKPLLCIKAINAGLTCFGDVLDFDCKPLTYAQIVIHFGPCIGWLHYMQLLKAIPSSWWVLVTNDRGENVEWRIEEMVDLKYSSRKLYNHLNDRMSNDVIRNRYHAYYKKIHEGIGFEEYCRLFEDLYKITKVTALRNFQYKLLMMTVYTNSTLAKWQIKESDSCEFCSDPQTLKHLFWECNFVQTLYEYAKNRYFGAWASEWNFCTVIENRVVEGKNNVGNLIVLLIKKYIYRQKCVNERLYTDGLDIWVESRERIDRNIAKKFKKLEGHIQKWAPIYPDLMLLSEIGGGEQPTAPDHI